MKRPRVKERVTEDERRKAAYLSEYAALCQRHGMMVIMNDAEDSGYSAFAVVEYSETDPELLERALEEMLLGDLLIALPPEAPDAET